MSSENVKVRVVPIIKGAVATSPLHPQNASMMTLLSMVRHFQQLFSVSCLEGIYPTMTLLSQQMEEYKNVYTRLKDMLSLGMFACTYEWCMFVCMYEWRMLVCSTYEWCMFVCMYEWCMFACTNGVCLCVCTKGVSLCVCLIFRSQLLHIQADVSR